MSSVSHGVQIAWKSKAQPLCALSSSESECIVISELVKEALFAKQVMEDIGHKVEVPIPCVVMTKAQLTWLGTMQACEHQVSFCERTA